MLLVENFPPAPDPPPRLSSFAVSFALGRYAASGGVFWGAGEQPRASEPAPPKPATPSAGSLNAQRRSNSDLVARHLLYLASC